MKKNCQFLSFFLYILRTGETITLLRILLRRRRIYSSGEKIDEGKKRKGKKFVFVHNDTFEDHQDSMTMGKPV